VPVTAIFAGLAGGMLLAAVGLALWDGFRPTPGLSRAVWAIGWVAGTLLLVGAMLAWWEGHRLSSFVWRLIFMAALAAPSGIRHRHRLPWSSAVRTLPALILAGIALFQIAGPVDGNGDSLVTPMKLALVFCGGLGTRSLGEALSEIIDPTSSIKWPAAATCALLTLLVSGAALVNLWQRGMLWKGTTEEGLLAGTWLAWVAAWLGPRERPRLRAVLITGAALLLCWTALTFP